MEEEINKKKSKIIEAADLPEGEKVYLKKDFMGWRVVEPYKNPETGKINKFNLILGGKRNVVLLILLMLLAGIIYLGFEEQISNYKAIAESPCSYCKSCQEQTNQVLAEMNRQTYKSGLPIINSTQLNHGG